MSKQESHRTCKRHTCTAANQNSGQGSVRAQRGDFRLSWIKGCFELEQAASAGRHSRCPITHPIVVVRSLVDLPAWSPDLFGRQVTSSNGRSTVRGECPSLPSPYLHQLNNREFTPFTWLNCMYLLEQVYIVLATIKSFVATTE